MLTMIRTADGNSVAVFMYFIWKMYSNTLISYFVLLWYIFNDKNVLSTSSAYRRSIVDSTRVYALRQANYLVLLAT